MARTATTPTGSRLIATLERTWRQMRRWHPDLPDVVIVTGLGASATPRGVTAKWGHFAPDRWIEGDIAEAGAHLDTTTRRPELFIAGDTLAQGALHVLETMLHEGAHGLAFTRKIKDTSRGHKYHNRRDFVPLAIELGLHWPTDQKPDGVAGYSEMKITDETTRRYRRELARLEQTIRLTQDIFWQLGLGKKQDAEPEGDKDQGGQDGEQGTAPIKERLKVVCGCQPARSFTIRKRQLDQAPITCGACGEDFEPVSAGRSGQASAARSARHC